MKMDAKRIIGRDGWAMLIAVGDEVEGEVCDRAALEQLYESIRPPAGTIQDLRGGPREFNVSLGLVEDRELRANGTELWVEFEAHVAAYRGRRAAFGMSAYGYMAICTPEERTLLGDREQRAQRPRMTGGRGVNVLVGAPTRTRSREVNQLPSSRGVSYSRFPWR